jgi:hypothetical protein
VWLLEQRAELRDVIEAPAAGARLERRVAFPQGARVLLGATSAAPSPGELPRTASLLAGVPTARLALVGASIAPIAPSAPLIIPGVAQGVAQPVSGQTLRTVWIPAALYLALNVGDVVSTYVGLQHGLAEGNPLVAALLTHDGFGALIVYKVIITLLVLLGVWVLSAWSDRAARLAVLICNALVALVVILNVAQVALLGR